jgi:hypothetical protein
MSTQHRAARWRALTLLCAALVLVSRHAPAIAAAPVLTISGTPVQLLMTATYYSFQPEAVDSQGRALTFSIANKPAWAQFDPATGLLSGSLGIDNAGYYPDVVISVSDGITQATLSPFSIVVQTNPTAGVVTLQWLPPTENTDASALTNLAGYHIYFGASPDALDNFDICSNPGIASYVISGLTAGTWYFALAAYNSQGVEGARSDVISSVVRY